MQSISKLLAVCLAVGQTQLANAAPLEERSCDLNDVVRLSLRDPAFAEEWTKRCAQPEIVEQILEKRETAPAYGGSSSSTSVKKTSSTTSKYANRLEDTLWDVRCSHRLG
ncbi:hypothetical protein LTR10_002189 [Elasticomyces elasticus]|uniref:Uncharacterized protein n=1 Tax=Elasticomyces elasticus TaxID=574655 RepID=A0AAN7WDF4_9PEZI|nr:hypothetical protein LTR10_002189 [Elasticomyces elasticus]KAK4973737.1 hypothetical protein LTR42_005726 [Elasticomyces elasticus]KAK5707846.1 hypothetical protein LTR97_000385 [Elasticomyces elasticus]